MKTAVKQSANRPTCSNGSQNMSAKFAKDHEILDLIRQTRGKCGDGVRMLPVVRYERKVWFLDERLRQLRNIRNPHDFMDLNDFEVEYFSGKVV